MDSTEVTPQVSEYFPNLDKGQKHEALLPEDGKRDHVIEYARGFNHGFAPAGIQ